MYFHSSVITAIQNKLHDEGYSLVICQSNESVEIEKELVNTLFASRVEGLIVSATLYTTDFSHFDIFPNSNIPLLFYDRIPKNYSAHVIRGDDYRGAYQATSHLLQQGCKKISFICGPLSCNLYASRYDGYKEALDKFQVPLDEELVFFQELTEENATEAGKKIFSEKSRVDAVFACNDTSAIAIAKYAKQLKIKIPRDLKIVGYTNDPRTEIIEPAITSVEQYPQEVGLQAAGLMIDILKQKIKPGKSFISVTTPIDLIMRGSTINV
jgi:LacI family transcriptional regulator